MKVDDAVDGIVRKPIKMISAEQNMKTMQRLMEDWHLGPEKTSVKPGANSTFWSSIAQVWEVPQKQARRMLCANCEYFENTPEMMEAMESIPLNDADMDGGGRGFCHKFDFICHNLRTCQAWEYKEYMGEE